jgi:hypothetical protein
MRCAPLTLRGSLVDADGKRPAVVVAILVAFLSVMPLLVVAMPVSANGGVADAEWLPESELRKNYSLFSESYVYSYGAEVGNEGDVENRGESCHYEIFAC